MKIHDIKLSTCIIFAFHSAGEVDKMLEVPLHKYLDQVRRLYHAQEGKNQVTQYLLQGLMFIEVTE